MTSERRGLVHVYTGDGKGKTTAAVGLAVRALGAGMRVAFVQFVKGGPRSSELDVLERMGVRVERPQEASSGLMEGGITDADVSGARDAWALAVDVVNSGEFDLVVLDEINVAVHHDLVPEEMVLALLEGRSPALEVVLTGRWAPEALLDYADLVTEMVPRKHPFEAGVPARRGIEF